MFLSMTGFGRSVSKGSLIAEILSVNRRYFEVFVFLPKELSLFEYNVRKWVGEKIARGQVTVRVQWAPHSKPYLPDVEMLQRLKKGWEKIAKELKIDEKQINLPFLLQMIPSSSAAAPAEEKSLRQCVNEALRSLLKMKEEEGKVLGNEIAMRLGNLKKMTDSVEKLSPDSAKKMRQKLLEKMKGVLKADPEIEDRIYREVALFAEKVDISEEITRLRSHFQQFRSLSEGRKMDFLVQEMGREINTIGSKSLDAKISHHVVEMKSELEKMREQIQNIE